MHPIEKQMHMMFAARLLLSTAHTDKQRRGIVRRLKDQGMNRHTLSRLLKDTKR